MGEQALATARRFTVALHVERLEAVLQGAVA
jgi:hypothetical protein